MANKLAFFLLFIFSQAFALAQTTKHNPNISKVENGLPSGVIFSDGTEIKYNIKDRMKFYKVPSVSIAVINNGKIEWAKSYGYADIQQKRVADVNTIYQAASISKSLNAMCVMKLYEQGKLSLNKNIRSYLKTWTFPDNEYSRGKLITIANLLGHTAGLGTEGFSGYSKNDTIPTLNAILAGKRPANNDAVKPILPPNTQAHYSGGGITPVRKILEDNINPDYAGLLQQTILQPLQMTHSSYSQTLNVTYENFAAAYDDSEKEVVGNFNIYPELAPDGLWSTSTDIAKLIISVQQSLQDKPGILKKATAEKMLTPVLNSTNMALGFFILQFGGEKYFAHTGHNLGYRGIYLGGMTNGKGVVILTNSENGEPLYNEILTSVAITYGWKGLYNPTMKTLVKVPDTLLDKYTGVYYGDTTTSTIKIEKINGHLQLEGENGKDVMYPTSNDTFFLLSAPTTIYVFRSSDTAAFDILETKEGDNVTVRKR